MKALILGNANFTGPDLISPAQLFPFFDNRAKLRQALDLTFEHVHAETFTEIEAACGEADVDAVFLRPSWQESPDEAERVLSKLKQENPDRKLIFLDPWDQVNSRFFNVLPYVDRFLKYQRLKDVTRYQQPLAGGTVITDYLVNELGYDIGDWYVGSEVPAGYESRIGTSWNVTLIKRFKRELLRRPMIWQPKIAKSIDVFCRVSYGVRGSHDWYGRYRQAAIAAIEPLEQHYKLAVNGEYVGDRVISSRQYFNEIRRSRIVVSPFGWGETTWRDYEAVCYDCLLIKPQMDHIDTQPNIYIPGETYVPVRWDFQDLEETCAYYLQHPEEADRIIQNARRVYKSYFEQGHFVKTVKDLLVA